MAGFGAKYPCWAPLKTEPANADPTYDPGQVLGKLVSASRSITNAEGELYGDDMRAEYLSEFASGTLDLSVTALTDAQLTALYGANVADGEITFDKDDEIPYGGVGFYQVLVRGGVKYYRGYFYPKCKAIIGDASAETKGSSINFTPEGLQFAIDCPAYGGWCKVETFDTEAAAIAWVKGKCSIS
ncbi:MAG: hypothetical protein IJH92_01905 [Mogibacterium sp.]|nr:hypothetical protein [Clostridia bacterium]MBR0307626.1 hypothetical protein [Mogibacterium sp.]